MLRFQDFDAAYIKVLSYFGFIPHSFLATEKLIISKKYKSYILLLMSLLGAVTIYSGIIKMTRENDLDDSIEKLLKALSGLSEISLFWLSGCGIVFFNSKKWNEMNRNLLYITELQSTFQHDSKTTKSDDSLYFFSLLFLVNSTYITEFIMVFFGSLKITHLTDMLIQLINSNQIFFLLYLIYKIKYAFQSLNEYYFKRIQKDETTSENQTDNKRFKIIRNMLLIRNFEKHYKRIDYCVSNLNAVYGWLILVAILKCFLTILLTLAYVIDAVGVKNPSQRFDWPHFVPVLLLTLICTIIFILTCDQVTIVSQSVPLVCSRLQDVFPINSKERLELANFCLYTRSNSVYISAAGFFDISKTTLLALISTVTTYFIVIIQFKDL